MLEGAPPLQLKKEKAFRCVAAKVCEDVRVWTVTVTVTVIVVSFFKVIHGWRFVRSVPHLGSLAEWMNND